MRLLSFALPLALCAVAFLTPESATACEPVTIFAAASTTDAVSEIAKSFKGISGCEITTVFASSSILAKQIDAGAPAAIYLSANESWMDDLETKGRLVAGTRTDILGNELVLIAPEDEPLDFTFDSGADLAAALGTGRLALGNPDGVPAGIYAKEALVTLGLWDNLSPNIVASEDVRGALAWVARGEARAGIVYRTDAQISSEVTIVATIPERSHKTIRYPIALIEDRENKTAREFLAYLEGAAGAAIFARYGFTQLTAAVN
ncbi:MAG: molybdate ABC transporter substrate-binding protein [Parvibaculum sp.]|nr:molybdate ABC transporter substrate-binding protein [Parvibaculum sp.]